MSVSKTEAIETILYLSLTVSYIIVIHMRLESYHWEYLSTVCKKYPCGLDLLFYFTVRLGYGSESSKVFCYIYFTCHKTEYFSEFLLRSHIDSTWTELQFFHSINYLGFLIYSMYVFLEILNRLT